MVVNLTKFPINVLGFPFLHYISVVGEAREYGKMRESDDGFNFRQTVTRNFKTYFDIRHELLPLLLNGISRWVGVPILLRDSVTRGGFDL